MDEHTSHSNAKQDSVSNPLIKQEDEELAVLGGKTRLVPHKSYSSSSSSGSKSPTSTPETSQLTYVTSPSTYTEIVPPQTMGFGPQAPGYTPDVAMYTLASPHTHAPQAPVSWPSEVYPDMSYVQMQQIPQMQHPMHHHQRSSSQYATDFPDPNVGQNMGFEYPVQTRSYSMVAQHQQASMSPQNTINEHTHASMSPQLLDPEVSWGTWVAQFNTL